MRKTLSTIVFLGQRPKIISAAVVTSNADSGAGSLRQAIAEATPGETITFAISGSIVLTSGDSWSTKTSSSTGQHDQSIHPARNAVRGLAGFRIFNLVTAGSSAFPVSASPTAWPKKAAASTTKPRPPSDCALLNNTATNNGGGIQNFSTGLSNCVVLNNRVAAGSSEGEAAASTMTAR